MPPRFAPALALLAAAAISAAGCGDDGAAAQGGHHGSRPAPVEVGQAAAGELLVEQRLLGEVRAQNRAELSVGASGEVRSVSVREGDRVTRGQVLLEIDPSLARAQVQRAQANDSLAQEERELAEWQATQVEQAGRRAVAEAEIQRSQTAAEAAQARREATAAELQEARNVLSRHRIVAPFDGVVVQRAVDPGDWIGPGITALSVVSDGDVEVLVAAPAELVLHVEPGMPARILPGSALEDALPNDEASVDAEVAGVVSALDTTTRTVTLRLVPADSRRWLISGSSVRVALNIRREDRAAVRIPRDALVRGAVGYRVIEIVDGKAQPHSVEVVATAAEEVLVRGEGLEAGDVVVTRGNERLRPEQDVVVQTPSDGEGEGEAAGAPAEGT